jgi:hypothetical protein
MTFFFAQGPANFAGQDFMLNNFYPQQFVLTKFLTLPLEYFVVKQMRPEVRSTVVLDFDF